MKIILLGINHAGTSAIRTLRAFDKKTQITAYDRNTNISFLGCGIALWVSGVVKNPKDLFYASPEELQAKDVTIKMGHDVINVDTEKKEILIKDLNTGLEFTDNYDKLIYAAGSWPTCFNWTNMDLEGIHMCKIYQQAEQIIEEAKSSDVKDVAVVGAGYIGIELVEAFHQLGKKVHLVDVIERPIGNYFDKEFTLPLMESMKKAGVNFHFGEKVKGFEGENGKVTKVITDKKTFNAELVVTCCGFSPNTQLLPDSLERVKNGAVKINANALALGQEDIYVIGDSAAIYNEAYKEHTHIALATNAVKTGVAAAAHIAGLGAAVKLDSVVGTNGINVFGHRLASTGITEEVAQSLGKNTITGTFFEDADRPEFMNEYGTVRFKLTYEEDTKRVVGGQVESRGGDNHSEIMFYIALAIQKGLTLYDLALTDVYFLPHYNKPFNYIISTILKALGINL